MTLRNQISRQISADGIGLLFVPSPPSREMVGATQNISLQRSRTQRLSEWASVLETGFSVEIG
jgi:hypothetical protein